MKPVRITSSSARAGRSAPVGDGAKSHLPAVDAEFRALTSWVIAKSRDLANLAEFSSSSRETMSALAVLIAETILSRWRATLTGLAAPRGPLPLFVAGLPQALVVVLAPSLSVKNVHTLPPPAATYSSPSVGKKFSTLKVASLRSPPTFCGAALAARVCWSCGWVGEGAP